MNTDSYWFQNPTSGWPMVLRSVPGGIAVDCEELDDEEPDLATIVDSREMTKAIRSCKDTHDAARVLYRDFDAKDIYL